MNSYQEVIEAWLKLQPPQGKKWRQVKKGDLRVSFWGNGLLWVEVFSAFKAKRTREVLVCDGLPEELVIIITRVAEQCGWELKLGVCPSEFLNQ